MGELGILAWPAFSNKKDNPYNYLIYSQIQKKGFRVYEFQFDLKNILKIGFSSKYTVLHFHWPNFILSTKNRFQAYRRLMTFFLFLKLIKLFKKKVVWTVHNLEAHENKYPELEKKLNAFLYSNVDGFISLNKTGLELIKKKAKGSQNQKFCYVPHPHYKNYYLNESNQEDARERLKINKNKFVFLFLGQIRPYKNVTGLIEAFKTISDDNSILLIAGSVQENMKAKVNSLIGNNTNIKLYDTFIKEKDLHVFINSADLIVTPYNQIFNSGSVFLNLSFNKPTLAPELGVFKELKQKVGPQWIKTYSGTISGEALKMSMQVVKAAKEEGKAPVYPKIECFDPEVIASQTTKFYKSLFLL